MKLIKFMLNRPFPMVTYGSCNEKMLLNLCFKLILLYLMIYEFIFIL